MSLSHIAKIHIILIKQTIISKKLKKRRPGVWSPLSETFRVTLQIIGSIFSAYESSVSKSIAIVSNNPINIWDESNNVAVVPNIMLRSVIFRQIHKLPNTQTTQINRMIFLQPNTDNIK